MQKILIRHLNGARAGQVDHFNTSDFAELIAGRDPASQIPFESDSDDLVSRQHLKIVRDPIDPTAFQVMDIQSRNGTYLNRKRIFGSVRVSHGDLVQLGPGGPEFSFELDPAPVAAHRPTREAAGPIKPTGERFALDRGLDTGGSRPVGRGTVEFMLDDAFGRVKTESRKTLWLVAAAVVAILVVGGTIWLALRQSSAANAAAQKAHDAQLAQMNQQLAQNPAEIEAMRKEIELLQGEIRDGQRQNQAALHRLSKQIESQNQEQGAAQPATPAAPAAGDSAEFAKLKNQANQLIGENKFREALEVSQNLMRLDSARYEGFALGGISMYFLNEFRDAASLLDTAASKAPDTEKDRLQSLAKQCRQKMASGK